MNSSFSLLIVDDNEMNRDMLARRLQRHGYQIAIAEDGYQALAKIEQSHYDMVLLDIMMPGLNGLEVLEILRRSHSSLELPIIMVTAKDQSDDIVSALRLGANDYVTKPVDFQIALARIQTHLEQRRLANLNDEFLSIASHDLKKPLALILDIAATMREEMQDGVLSAAEAPQLLELIRQSGEQMKTIIEDFLDLHAVEGGFLKLNKAWIDLNILVEDRVEANQEYAKRKQIMMKAALLPGLPKVHADAKRILQVIDNFIGNALKFSPPHTEVLVRTEQQSDAVRIIVSDQGPGLTADDLQKLFNKFSRLSNAPTGGEKSTGLGLSICKQLVDLHNGVIKAENNPTRGASFICQLPLTASPAS